MATSVSASPKFIPGSDGDSDDIFTYPFTVDAETIEFLQEHGRIMFIIRGPPGTGKDSLTNMLFQRYPKYSICSADNYFRDTFNSSKRDSHSLKLSHEYCHKKVEQACRKNAHPIIVKNTHMRKRELQEYLDYAAEYNYTIVMAITIDKFKVTPDILAKSNTKGLNAQYFERRLKQWEDVIPVHTGWFLCPEDSSFLLSDLQKALDFLLGDDKFCRTMNVFEKANLLSCYKARKLLYCVAACGENNTSDEIKPYYLSTNVKDHYGQCFIIVIQGYLVTPSYIAAVVQLDETMKTLRYLKKNNGNADSDDVDLLVKQFQPFNIGDNFKKHTQTIDFIESLVTSGETAQKENWRDTEVINLKYCSFIHLAASRTDPTQSLNYNSLFKTLKYVADKNDIIHCDQCIELEGIFKVCRLTSDAWFVRPPFKISFRSVFTGLYI